MIEILNLKRSFLRIAKIAFSIMIIISLGLAMIIKSPYEPRLKAYITIGLLLISIMDRRVFARQREKDKDIPTFLISLLPL